MRKILGSLLAIAPLTTLFAQTVIKVDQRVLEQHVLTRQSPLYPAIAVAARVSGTVVLQVEVGPNGRVIDTKPISGPPMLIPAATNAAKQWTFRPFLADGVPSHAAGPISIAFNLPPDAPERPIQKFAERVHARYVQQPFLAQNGFACDYKPVWSEFPQVQSEPSDSAITTSLNAAKLRVMVKPPAMPFVTIAKGSSDAAQPPAEEATIHLAEQLAQGFFPTWLTLAPNGPGIPSDAELSTTGEGYTVKMNQQGQAVELNFDKELRLEKITQTSPGSSLTEIPKFIATEGGLLYSGSETDIRNDSGKVNVRYDLTYQRVGTYQLPQAVHMQVNNNVNLHLQFMNCVIGQPVFPPPPGRVLDVRPPQ